MTYIYVLQDPFTGAWRYIGKMDDPKTRLKNHCNEKSKCHRSHWIQSLRRRGVKPVMRILQQVPAWASWQDVEKMWIRYAIESAWPITNGTMGGDGNRATPETRAKISASRKGQKLNAHQREVCIRNLKRVKIGDKMPETTRQKIAVARLGAKFTDEHRKSISVAKRKITTEQLQFIKDEMRKGTSQRKIASVVGVSQPTISAIKKTTRKYLND